MRVTATGSVDGLDCNRHSPNTSTAQIRNPTATPSALRRDRLPAPLKRAAALAAKRNTTKLIPQRPVTEAIWISGRKSICVYARLPQVLCGDAMAVRYSQVTQ